MTHPFLPDIKIDPIADVNALLHEALAISDELTALLDQGLSKDSSSLTL